jgi:ribokinase
MGKFFIAGLINIETTVAINGFPLEYIPAHFPFYGLFTAASGVGLNIAKALTSLGNQVDFASLVSADDNGFLARKTLTDVGISDDLVLNQLEATAQSVILYAPDGRRQIHVDLKNIQNQEYPIKLVEKPIQNCDLAVICNINFARPFLELARDAGKWIATDVHAISDLDDDYNRDYMGHAQILFVSDEKLPDSPERVSRDLMDRYKNEIIVIGLGGKGALMAIRKDDFIGRFEPVYTRPVVNTIGAGDALFSSFLDGFLRTKDPYQALRRAMVFASYKIGEKGAAEEFLSRTELDYWVSKVENQS